MTFHFDIGGFDAITTEVTLKDNHLHIYEHHGLRRPYQKPLLVNIKNNSDWDLSVEFLKRCKWKAEYYEEVYDGTQWTLRAATGDVKLSYIGSNAFPEDFDYFLRVLNKLTSHVNISLT